MDPAAVADRRAAADATTARPDLERNVLAIDAGQDDHEGDRAVGFPLERVRHAGDRRAQAADLDGDGPIGPEAIGECVGIDPHPMAGHAAHPAKQGGGGVNRDRGAVHR